MTVSRFLPALLLVALPAAADDEGSTFTACMRDHGLPDFPEVTVDADGRLQLDAPVDVFSDAYRSARDACTDQLPEGTDLPSAPDLPDLPALPEGLTLPGCD